jgi:chaperonin cofactor prefoldin
MGQGVTDPDFWTESEKKAVNRAMLAYLDERVQTLENEVNTLKADMLRIERQLVEIKTYLENRDKA